MKRSFFGFSKPRLTYEAIADTEVEPASIEPAEKIKLLLDTPV